MSALRALRPISFRVFVLLSVKILFVRANFRQTNGRQANGFKNCFIRVPFIRLPSFVCGGAALCVSWLKIRPGLAVAVGLLPRRRSLQTATILILFGICIRTLRRRDKISVTHSGWIISGELPRVALASREQPWADFRSAFSSFQLCPSFLDFSVAARTALITVARSLPFSSSCKPSIVVPPGLVT